MLERLLKYWPVITVAALTIVSVFNIGYFSIIGLHFLGVMDLSNIVYSVGLVFSLMIAPIVMFPDNLITAFKEIASSQKAMLKLNRTMKFVVWGISLFFAIGLFVHRPYISIMGLFALDFLLGFLAVCAYVYIVYLHTGSIPARMTVAVVAFGLFTLFWIGGAVAYHEAFGTSTLYKVTTKDTAYDNARLARSSSNGFIIAKDKKIIYIPSAELKSISLVEPADKNP
jgi:hypothetical protein